MMNKKQTILSLLLLAALPVAAQKLVSVKTTVDVGRTGYQQPVTAVFEFQNKSHRKMRITQVVPDCNCTTLDYPKGDIGGNGKFEVRMTYNARQLGHFDKQAAIVTNGNTKPVYVRMTGVVLTEVLDFSGSYPVEMGDLRLDKSVLEFDDINRGDIQEQELHIYNNGTKVYHPNLMHLPPYLTAVVTPERLNPGKAGKMTVTLNSAKLRDYGLTQTSVYLAGNPGDKVSPDHEIAVSAVLLPSFSDLSSSARSQAPHIQLSKEVVNLDFKGKAKAKDVIDITNTGQSALEISSLQMFTGGLVISLGKKHLNPGETTKLKITAERAELMKSRTRPRILMIVNDPQKPKVVITINPQ
jgi:hypothetical protein